ncbi:MAG: hypothetical protein AB7N70_34025 [Dehalococcoidia bacterium]
MYTALLYLHSYNRWLVLASAAAALVLSWRAFLARRGYGPAERTSSRVFMRLLDVQVLLGLGLYALSPIVRIALGDLGAAMAVKELRFFGVEHITGMVLALVLANVGAVRVRRAESDALRLRRAVFWQTATVLVIAVSIPWWRPWVRI